MSLLALKGLLHGSPGDRGSHYGAFRRCIMNTRRSLRMICWAWEHSSVISSTLNHACSLLKKVAWISVLPGPRFSRENKTFVVLCLRGNGASSESTAPAASPPEAGARGLADAGLRGEHSALRTVMRGSMQSSSYMQSLAIM